MRTCALRVRPAETVWSAVPDDANLRNLLDMKEFEQLFQAKTKTTAAAQTEASNSPSGELKRRGTKAEQLNILEPKRSYNIGIIVSRMRMSFPAIRQCFLNMDDHRPTDEEIKALLTVIPTADEVRPPSWLGRLRACPSSLVNVGVRRAACRAHRR